VWSTQRDLVWPDGATSDELKRTVKFIEDVGLKLLKVERKEVFDMLFQETTRSHQMHNLLTISARKRSP
jgi:predicted DNA-binding protein YlxM (UPF0122 family)